MPIRRLRQLITILFTCSCMYMLPQGVDQPGTYGAKSHAEQCYRSFYKPPEKLDTLVKPEGMIVHRIWRVIDLKNTTNRILLTNNSKNCDYTDLFEVLKFGLRSGKIKAFTSDRFGNAAQQHLSMKEVNRRLVIRDTVTESVFDADGNGTTNTKIINEDMQSLNLSGYVICEDWYIDKHWSRREKRIICICPVYFNEKLQKEVPLFYLYYNECRDLLSSFRAQKTGTGLDLSYDEIFLRKYFESMVVKTSNVFGRPISEYTLGTGTRDEGDRSVRQLLNEEADLFEH